MHIDLGKKSHTPHPENMAKRYPLLRRIGRDPHVDWALMLSAAFLLSVVFILLGFAAYRGVDRALVSASPSVDQRQAVHFDAKTLSSVMSSFDTRAEVRAHLVRGYSGPTDPSI